MTSQPPRRGPAEQAAVAAAIVELYERRISFNEVLGLRAEGALPGETPTMVFEMRAQLVGHYLYGRLHGGVIATALDAVGSYVLMLGLAERHSDENAEQIIGRFARMGTIDLRIDYLRQGIGARFVASAEITRMGGRIGSTLMRLRSEDGTLIATGAGSYILS